MQANSYNLDKKRSLSVYKTLCYVYIITTYFAEIKKYSY